MYDDIACQHCGVIGGHAVTLLAAGHHYARLDCGHCGRWMKWLKNPNVSDAERAATKQAVIDAYMQAKAPTDKQVAYLHALGCNDIPGDRLEASQLIERLKRGR